MITALVFLLRISYISLQRLVSLTTVSLPFQPRQNTYHHLVKRVSHRSDHSPRQAKSSDCRFLLLRQKASHNTTVKMISQGSRNTAHCIQIGCMFVTIVAPMRNPITSIITMTFKIKQISAFSNIPTPIFSKVRCLA